MCLENVSPVHAPVLHTLPVVYAHVSIHCQWCMHMYSIHCQWCVHMSPYTASGVCTCTPYTASGVYTCLHTLPVVYAHVSIHCQWCMHMSPYTASGVCTCTPYTASGVYTCLHTLPVAYAHVLHTPPVVCKAEGWIHLFSVGSFVVQSGLCVEAHFDCSKLNAAVYFVCCRAQQTLWCGGLIEVSPSQC